MKNEHVIIIMTSLISAPIYSCFVDLKCWAGNKRSGRVNAEGILADFGPTIPHGWKRSPRIGISKSPHYVSHFAGQSDPNLGLPTQGIPMARPFWASGRVGIEDLERRAPVHNRI